MGAQEYGKSQPLMNFEFQKYELQVDEQNSFSGLVDVSITTLFPNRGTVSSSYHKNRGNALIPYYLYYDCNEKFRASSNSYIRFYLPS